MSRLSLREVLGGAGAVPYLRPAVEHALAAPWCWPRDPAMDAAARAYVSEAPADPAHGEVLLVSVAEGAEREALWALRWKHGRSHRGVALGPTMTISMELAARHAAGVVPHLHTISPTTQLPRFATQVCKRGNDADRVLDDVSYGLSLFLAASSELMGRAVSRRLAASAALREDGALMPVRGLGRKLSMLVENALSVDTVLVAKEQQAEATAFLVTQPRRVRAVGLGHVSEAIDEVFAEARVQPPAAWQGEAVGRVVADLIELCRKGAPVQRWSAVVRSSEWLLARTDLAPTTAARLRVAAQIARRHAQGSAVTIDWDAAVGPSHDREMAAHVVQAAADAGTDALDECLRRAEALLEPWDDAPAARKLSGAVGRALAAQRRYEEAARYLAPATRSWLDDGEVKEASYPLCEWLRVAAIMGRDGGWSEAVGCAERYLARADDVSDLGPAFVRFALGRGLVTRREFTSGLAALEGIDRARTPPFLWRSTLRWEALGLAATGRRERAKATRAELVGEYDEYGQPTIEGLFAALDEALERGEAPDGAMAAIREANPQGVRWLFDRELGAVDQARRLAMEYPY